MGTHCCFFSLQLDPLRSPMLILLILLCSAPSNTAHTLALAMHRLASSPSPLQLEVYTHMLSAVGCGALAIIPVLQRRKQIKTQMRMAQWHFKLMQVWLIPKPAAHNWDIFDDSNSLTLCPCYISEIDLTMNLN